MSSKRKGYELDIDIEDVIQSVDLEEGWMQKLLEVDDEELALIIGDLANQSNLTNKSIKKARTTLPSFCTEKWADFARRVDLPTDPEYLGLEFFKTPVYQLPPSFHEAVVENS